MTKIVFDFEKGRKKLFPLGYSQMQVDLINAIMDECNGQAVVLMNQVAYILATPYHECFDWHDPRSRMTQLTELGGEKYLRSKAYYPWYGRGPSHLTHKKNYQAEGKRLGLDLVRNPDLMLDINRGANSHVFCMMNGKYTGVKLPTYVNRYKTDFPNARRVINGKDKADLIAGYATQFLACLTVIPVPNWQLPVRDNNDLPII